MSGIVIAIWTAVFAVIAAYDWAVIRRVRNRTRATQSRTGDPDQQPGTNQQLLAECQAIARRKPARRTQ